HWVREVVGWQHVEAAQEAGRGILFLTPHLGNFEITAPAYSQKAGRPITVLYRPSKWRALDALMQHRAREEMHTAPADLSGVRKLFRALKRGEAVGMLPDQTPKAGEGQWLPFFGKPAYTMTLAARLSETGATVLLAYGERLPDGEGFCLHFERPDVPIEGDTALRAQAINQEMERLILRLPGQYLWGYNRYKGRPNADLSASPSGDAL
ncbi:MAG: lysophospholipid acyltransferase family protein, partial [Zoogloeaceae bacterium]|nr:lysophospholipid acyltransferase family protein [Zoogloeaceae bacterium]